MNHAPAPSTRTFPAIPVLALLFVFYCYPMGIWPRFIGPNETSRVFLTMSLYEEGSVRLDRQVERYWSHNDLAYRDGHAYSNKSPGSSLWMLLFTPLVDALTPGRIRLMDLMYFGRVLALTLPFVGFLFLLGRELERRAGPALAWGLVLAYALGSNASVYATMYYSHNLTAAAHVTALLLLLRKERRRTFLAGLLTGFGVLSEVMTIVVPAALLAYAWVSAEPSRRRREATTMAAGLGLMAGAFMIYNWTAFGNPFQLGYSFSGAHLQKYSGGQYGLRFPRFQFLPLLLFSLSRGMFANAPWTLFVLPAAWHAWKRRRDPAAASDLLCLACAAALMFTVLSGPFITSGFATGSRYVIPILPFLLFPILAWLRDLDPSRRPLAVIGLTVCAALGVAQNALALMVFPIVPVVGYGLQINPFKIYSLYALSKGYGTFTLATLAGAGVHFSNGLFAVLCAAPWVVYAAWLKSYAFRWLRASVLGLLLGALGVLVLSEWGPTNDRVKQEQRAMLRWMYDDSQRGRLAWR